MRTVLVVDDDEDIREELGELLEAEGYDVLKARDGEDALEVLTSTPVHPCIVLLDMMMPRMNGNEVMEALAKTPLAQMPIVVISAYPGDVHQTARRVLRKPMNPDTVLDVVEEFCPPYAS